MGLSTQQLFMLSVKEAWLNVIVSETVVLSYLYSDMILKCPVCLTESCLMSLGDVGVLRNCLYSVDKQCLPLALSQSGPADNSQRVLLFLLLKFFYQHLIMKFRCTSHSTNNLGKRINQNLCNIILHLPQIRANAILHLIASKSTNMRLFKIYYYLHIALQYIIMVL